jgi:hypothetical protein
MLAFHKSHINEQHLVFILLQDFSQILFQLMTLPGVELATEHGILNMITPACQQLEHSVSPFVVGNIVDRKSVV